MATTTDVRSEILMAAGPIFAELGFEKATVRDICRAAGVNLAAVNYYFGDKQQLYVATVKHAYELRSTRAPMPSWQGKKGHPEAMLRGFIRALVERMLGPEQNWVHGLLLREVLSPTEACLELVEDYFRPQMEFLIEILRQLLPPGVPIARRRQLALGIVGQCMFYRVAAETARLIVPEAEQQEHFSLEQIASHITEFVLSGVQNCPAAWIAKADQRTETFCHPGNGQPASPAGKSDISLH